MRSIGMGTRWVVAAGLVLSGLVGSARAEDACFRGRWQVDLREWRALAPTCVAPLADPGPSDVRRDTAEPGSVRWMVATSKGLVTDTVVRDEAGALANELSATNDGGDVLWSVRLPPGASLPVYSQGRLYVLSPANGGLRLVEHALDSGAPVRQLKLDDVTARDLDEAVLRENAPGLLELTATLGRCG